LEKIFSTS